jgi:hypothetical protein
MPQNKESDEVIFLIFPHHAVLHSLTLFAVLLKPPEKFLDLRRTSALTNYLPARISKTGQIYLII